MLFYSIVTSWYALEYFDYQYGTVNMKYTLGVCMIVKTQVFFQWAMQRFSKVITVKKTFEKKNKTKADKLIIFLNPLWSILEIWN